MSTGPHKGLKGQYDSWGRDEILILYSELEDRTTSGISSIEKWGGFYIGRYETGQSGGSSRSNGQPQPGSWYELDDGMYESHWNEYGGSSGDYWERMILAIEYVTAKRFIANSNMESVIEYEEGKSLKNIYDIGTGLNEFTTARILHRGYTVRHPRRRWN